MTREVAPWPARSFSIRTLPFFEPEAAGDPVELGVALRPAPGAMRSATSRARGSGARRTRPSPPGRRRARRPRSSSRPAPGSGEASSSIRLKRLPGSAITSRRQKSAPPSGGFATRTYSGCSRTTPFGTCTSRPYCQLAAFWAANFSSAPTSSPSCGCDSSSTSNRIPSGARSISTPPATVAKPATSMSNIASRDCPLRHGRFDEGVRVEALEVGEAPRLVGRRRHRQRAIALEELSPGTLLLRRVTAVEDQHVAVEILDEAHVADPAVHDPDHLAACGPELLDGALDVRDAKGDPGRIRLKRLAVRLGRPERDRHVRRLELALAVLALGQTQHVPVERNRSAQVTRRH